jgi:hypothetical protein
MRAVYHRGAIVRAGVVIVLACVWAFPAPDDLASLRRAFQSPPDDARMMMRWWWFGPSVARAGLEREMRLMKEGGIGGFEVQPVYPLALDEPSTGIRNFNYLSGEFLDALRFTAAKARELGLRMDLTLGSGWPFGGPHVPIAQAAGRLRWERVKTTSARVPLPAMGEGEKFLAAFAGGTRRELSGIRDGVLWLEGGDRPAEVWFFIASRTGMMVKRPAMGAEGFVHDHYDRAALANHLRHVADPMMHALGDLRPHAVFCDSLEVFGSDWAADLPEEFARRRGYDLRPYLPALVADVGPEALAVRHDWGRTLSELVEERFYAPLHEWSRANRTLFRIQGYGIPPATMASYAVSDLPEGEGAHWKQLQSARWAASASHIFGKPVSSSETWTWLHSPSFRATPLDMKTEGDLHLLQGVTQLIGHGWPYTPEGVSYPGWRFYAAGVFNDRNPWWIAMPDVAAYFQRASFLLRQGKPANDVALYLPVSDAWSRLGRRTNLLETLRERLGPAIIGSILESGYGLDVFDDGSLERAGRVEKGALALGANRYRMVVLPALETIPVATLRKLDEFARSGGLLIATRRLPSSAPGFKASEADHAEVRATMGRLFEGEGAPGALVADESGFGRAAGGRLAPDVALSPAAPALGFVHRTTPFAEIYFLANTGASPIRARAAFRVAGLNPEWWDPKTGAAAPAAVLDRGERTASVDLALEPYGSRFLVFSRDISASPQASNHAAPPAAVDISAGWTVALGNARPAAMERLRSWTDDESSRYFSGVGVYTREIGVTPGFLARGRVTIDFGEGKPLEPVHMRNGMRAWLDAPVREAAVVFVNGQRAGAVWSPPYAVEITKLLKAGSNQLRVEVGNLALNHMAGRPLPDYRLLHLRYGVRFEPQDMDKVEPIPSGMMGPIRLIAGN